MNSTEVVCCRFHLKPATFHHGSILDHKLLIDDRLILPQNLQKLEDLYEECFDLYFLCSKFSSTKRLNKLDSS